MRTVILEPIKTGDLSWKRITNTNDPYQFEVNNRNFDSVFFIDPKLRMSVVSGVTIIDPTCTRDDRVFGRDTSYRVAKGRGSKTRW